MSGVTQELVRIVDALPEDKARAVVDFARFLQLHSSDREWEHILANQQTYPKLDRFVADALREGSAETLDPGKL